MKDGISKSDLPVLMDINGVSYAGKREGIYGTPPSEYPGFFKVVTFYHRRYFSNILTGLHAWRKKFVKSRF